MAISLIVFTCVFGGALLGMFLHAVLPEHHLSTDSKELVKLGIGVIATMAALVLGFPTASAKSSYDTRRSELTQIAANIILLDRVMGHYGPETKEARELLRRSVARAVDQIWPAGHPPLTELGLSAESEDLYDKIQKLSPQNDAQRSLHAQALRITADLGHMRWLLFEQGGGSTPSLFLVMLVFWLVIIFISFGLFAPQNATVVATLLVCALRFQARSPDP